MEEVEQQSPEAAVEVEAPEEVAPESASPEVGVPDDLSAEDVSVEASSGDVIFAEAVVQEPAATPDDTDLLKAVIEAAIYITDEPLTAEQIAAAVEQPIPRVKEVLAKLVSEYAAPDRGLSIREIAGGYKMATKPEHHEAIRQFVKKLQPPLKLSLAALETLAVVAYKQPITGPEILEIRGVQGAGVLKTLLDRKLIAAAGRKDVIGKPILYKTTREFLVQFGLNSLSELPTLKEFEELGRFALSDSEDPAEGDTASPTQESAPPIAQAELALEEPPPASEGDTPVPAENESKVSEESHG